MNLTNFYDITKIDSQEDSVSVTIQLHPAHEVFKGHFPNHPVLPGVAMFQICKEIIEAHFSKTLRLQKVNRVKFINLVNPNDNETLVFNLEFEQEDKILKVKNNVTFVDEIPVMKGMLLFTYK